MKKTQHSEDAEQTYYVIKPFFVNNVKKTFGHEMVLHKSNARSYVNGGFLTPDKKLADNIIRERIEFISDEIEELKKILSPASATRTTTKKDAQ